MLGRTNLVLSEASADVSLVQENILTKFSFDFVNLKYINNKFFTIRPGSQYLIYGDSAASLVKVDITGHYLQDIIWAKGVYYIPTPKGILSSTDLETFNKVSTKIEISGSINLFYDDNIDKFIIVNLEVDSTATYKYRTVLYTADDLAGEWTQLTIMTSAAQSFNWSSVYANGRVLYYSEDDNNGPKVFDLTGCSSLSPYFTDIYADGYFWIAKNNVLYKSLNGGDYSKVYAADGLSGLRFIKDYNGYMAFVGYIQQVDGAYKYFIAVAADASAKAVEKAMQSKIEFLSDYDLYDMACVDDTIYFGASSGMIIKAQFGNEEEHIPADVILIKTLSAKQALAEAKSYTDTKYAELEARIAVMEAGAMG